jgi:hypothetical protein
VVVRRGSLNLPTSPKGLADALGLRPNRLKREVTVSAKVRAHIRSNIIGYIALFFALSTGSAVALSGSNTVFTDDIVDNQVYSADVRNDTLSGGGLGAADLKAASVGTSEVALNSLSGGDINESLLGIVPNANNARGVDALFGDGSDGDQTIASNTTLNRDTYYHNLTINPGTTLNPGGFRIFVSGTLTLGDGAAIARDGNGFVSSAGGAGLSSGTLGGSGAGGNMGTSGESVVNSLGGAGGPGNFAAGSATPPPDAAGGAQVFHHALSALSGRSLDGELVTGGGGGGGAGGGLGDGGGGGGGVVVVVARSVALGGPAAITADGGAGGTTFGASGGGGGGVVVVITATAKPAALTLSAAGGSGTGGVGAPGFTAWLD